MTISNSTLSADVWTSIKNILVASSIKVTNSTTSAKKQASILAAYNDNKPAIPQIIINPINITENTYKFGSSEGKKFINVMLECYYDSTLGIDQMADACKASIKAACDAGTLSGIDLVGITEDYAFVDPNQAKFHLKTLTFTFDRE